MGGWISRGVRRLDVLDIDLVSILEFMGIASSNGVDPKFQHYSPKQNNINTNESSLSFFLNLIKTHTHTSFISICI